MVSALMTLFTRMRRRQARLGQVVTKGREASSPVSASTK
jgi:hypothetical protein